MLVNNCFIFWLFFKIYLFKSLQDLRPENDCGTQKCQKPVDEQDSWWLNPFQSFRLNYSGTQQLRHKNVHLNKHTVYKLLYMFTIKTSTFSSTLPNPNPDPNQNINNKIININISFWRSHNRPVWPNITKMPRKTL